MIRPATRTQIKGYLEGFIQGMINEHRTSSLKSSELRPTKEFSKEGDIKPFHEALLPDGILRINEFERSFSTKLGASFEECARLIGLQRYQEVARGYRVQGKVSRKAAQVIERSVNSIGSKGVSVGYGTLVKRALKVADGDGTEREKTADLYLKDKKGNELFFEIKSPKPNKGQCLEATERMLHIHVMRRTAPPRVRTYFAMAYNPYGTRRDSYEHSFTIRYMDFDDQVLVGKEFWDLIGGNGTYEEVLEIYRDVGKQKGPDLLDQLALDY